MKEKGVFICQVCENTRWTNVYRIGEWNIEECVVCGLARIDPLPTGESRPELYSKENVVSRNTKQQTRSQKFSKAMKRLFIRIMNQNKSAIFYDKFSRYLPAGSKVLDVGCGDGSSLKLTKRRFVCTGIEISEYLADLAKKQGDIKVITGDFLTSNLVNEKFDGITLISLLEHLNDPKAAIRKCFDLMNRGGVLLIKTVNYGCLNRMIKKKQWTGFRPPDHIFYFNSSNLKSLLEKTGFTKIKISAWPFNDNMYSNAWK